MTGIPLIVAPPRPCDEIRRVTIRASSSSTSPPPRIASTSTRRPGSETSNTAEARASVLPDRISSAETLPPRTRPSAVNNRLLPAPVSPVQAQ